MLPTSIAVALLEEVFSRCNLFALLLMRGSVFDLVDEYSQLGLG